MRFYVTAPEKGNCGAQRFPVPSPATAVTQELMARHRVHDMQAADNLFAAGRFDDCRWACLEILRADPSEAIRARCHLYLADGRIAKAPHTRIRHAAAAVHAWERVVRPDGTSRFPVEQARAQLEKARGVYRAERDAGRRG